ncbi:histidine kinase [Sulfuricaulis limicola]|uniref:histidine kinase n=1 Tax=Sulfuricaulis limicola TaxID=1620215 RepID=A0A1B4XH55_9GAMM|nr:histidine kinase [Sulfuricaulis limicola]
MLKTGALQNAILHSANFSIIATDEKGIIQLFNIGAERMLGYRAAEVVNKISPSDIHDPQEVLARAQALSLELATPITPGFEALAFKASRGIEDSYELTYIRKDGSRFPVIVSITALRGDHDAIIGYLLIGADNTARQREKEALHESEERYRTLFESIDEGFCLIEMIFDEHKNPVDYRFLEVNPSLETLTGLRVTAGDRMLELSPNHEAHWFETYGKVAMTGEPIRFVNEAKNLGGRWFDVYAFRVGGRDSRKVAVLFTNITERKRLDQVLRDQNAELERARFVAEKANSAKSDFLSSMSHELRSPLNAILGFAQLMESGSPQPTSAQQASIGQILQAGWYLLDLINEVLDLALIESGKLSISQEPVSLVDVMLECQAMIEPQAQKSGIHMSFPRFEAPYFVKADRTRVKQVLINLLSNAIKYNRAQGTVEVTCLLKTAQRLRISVRDSGEGLSPDKLAQLFQPFNRLGQEANTEEGTGIGLVVSKQLVELMGGEIGVESTVGVGSIFWIELNVAAEPQPGTGSDELFAPIQAQSARGAALRTLLYVEDNHANMQLVEQLIARRPDMRLLMAGDGSHGIALARTHQPEVILMDINLPGINGFQALKILRDDPATAHIPVLAISANAMPRDIQRGLEAGFLGYLTKPIRIKEFMEALDRALEFSETELDGVINPGSL